MMSDSEKRERAISRKFEQLLVDPLFAKLPADSVWMMATMLTDTYKAGYDNGYSTGCKLFSKV